MNRKERQDQEPTYSKLCQTVKKDGWELDIVIFDEGDGKWRLQVIDDSDGCNHWYESFDTDQQALDAALKAIEEEGIEGFCMPQPWREH